MSRFLLRIVAAIVIGWFAGVAVARMIDPTANVLPAFLIPPAWVAVYGLSFLVVPRGR